MKNLTLISVGALLGAAIVWFGFSKQFFLVNGSILAVNRFTDDVVNLDIRLGPIQQKQNDEADKAAADQEKAQQTQQTKDPSRNKESAEQLLTEEQLTQLQQNVTFVEYAGPCLDVIIHNPFRDMIIKRFEIHVQWVKVDGDGPPFPPDRDYTALVNPNLGCFPLADGYCHLEWNLSGAARKNAKITITKAFVLKES